MATGLATRDLPSAWSGAVLVCGKCSKKLGGGFGRKGKVSLSKALRQRFGLKKGRKAAMGVVEVKCLGVCPRGAVTLVDMRVPGRWRLVPAGADIDALGAEVGLRPAAPAPPDTHSAPTG
jgi:predicted metal-binding protein